MTRSGCCPDGRVRLRSRRAVYSRGRRSRIRWIARGRRSPSHPWGGREYDGTSGRDGNGDKCEPQTRRDGKRTDQREPPKAVRLTLKPGQTDAVQPQAERG